MDDKVQINSYIPAELNEELAEYLERTGRKKTWVIEQAIRLWLDSGV